MRGKKSAFGTMKRHGAIAPHSSQLELGNGQLLGGDRLGDIGHGRPGNDGGRDARPGAHHAPGWMDRLGICGNILRFGDGGLSRGASSRDDQRTKWLCRRGEIQLDAF